MHSRSARNCLLVNLLATPGLGSILGGRWIAGGFQLLLAVCGVGLVIAWMALTLKESYGLMDQSGPPRSFLVLGLAGAALFAVAWFWSLFTSLSLMREAREKRAADLATDRVPPRYNEE